MKKLGVPYKYKYGHCDAWDDLAKDDVIPWNRCEQKLRKENNLKDQTLFEAEAKVVLLWYTLCFCTSLDPFNQSINQWETVTIQK